MLAIAYSAPPRGPASPACVPRGNLDHPTSNRLSRSCCSVTRAHVFLEHDLLRRGGTHHRGQPAPMRGAPVGPAFVANILPQQKRFQPTLAPRQIIHRVLAPAAQVPHGLVLDLGHVTLTIS